MCRGVVTWLVLLTEAQEWQSPEQALSWGSDRLTLIPLASTFPGPPHHAQAQPGGNM